MTIQTAFIGLGAMGYPMAGHLQKAGYSTTVFNRSKAKAELWSKVCAGTFANTPKKAAENKDVVLVCVGNDQDVREVIYGEHGALVGMKKGAILVDHTTTSAELALELKTRCEEVGCDFVDAPVSGGQAGAETGKLTVMCGGRQTAFERVSPLLQSYAKQIQLMGPTGQGQRSKMVNQICISGVLSGLSEALLLAEKVGLDIQQVVDTLKHGAAGSWQMENRLQTMSENKFNFGFAIDWMHKDLSICLAEAEKHRISMPFTSKVDQHYQALQKAGMGRLDTSALIKAFR
ncbi:NAD(P)-dependent oxidoreductase [Paraglaciecola arctica]|uniref:NAD(P)-dependent oxidoreductase n=1 Tax=Paraglaciecola arctica TaxID=1128911 RepID=UPI001C0707B3|nr:NAD(P)-dependent oxidoreductase [Paraglaciecola arctica]MBU3001997.1 NAD(P)-dependent oxidoreductase [Paraglaciecola arctica]